MKIHHIYSDKDGILRACVEPVPVEPKDWTDDDGCLASLSSPLYARKTFDYRKALQHCKDSSVPFENQEQARIYWGCEKRDCLYHIDEVEVTLRCNNDCQADCGDCCHPDHCQKLARLSPVAPEPSFKENPDVNEARTNTFYFWLARLVKDHQIFPVDYPTDKALYQRIEKNNDDLGETAVRLKSIFEKQRTELKSLQKEIEELRKGK